jgi:hypothetical protein
VPKRDQQSAGAARRAQLALASVHAQGDGPISIPGTKDPSRAAQNVAALEIALSAETLARLDVAVATQPLVGERYPAPVMRTVGVLWRGVCGAARRIHGPLKAVSDTQNSNSQFTETLR